ncbi:unnamed protein product [Meloidogyne enterolobii]|uniref:Uncharacterized protein n=1 Tax=Meloidogyne enterolobii TaxID=390850 RepID=A0ACB0Y0A6_MELEN
MYFACGVDGGSTCFWWWWFNMLLLVVVQHALGVFNSYGGRPVDFRFIFLKI